MYVHCTKGRKLYDDDALNKSALSVTGTVIGPVIAHNATWRVAVKDSTLMLPRMGGLPSNEASRTQYQDPLRL